MLLFSLPFALLLLAIAVLPLAPARYGHWWESNRNKFLVSLGLALVVLGYYALRGSGVPLEEGSPERSSPGVHTMFAVVRQTLLADFVPFIVLLFCLYTISGGIRVLEDIEARPLTNAVVLALGAVLANVIGTTGASMLLIRPLLQINSERKYVAHTVVFFIFLVSNVGGCLTPIGDPPLFLGYLHGVPFLWTLSHLWPVWLFAVLALLITYTIWDTHHFRREPETSREADRSVRVPLGVIGKSNLVLLAATILVVATVVPGRPFLGTRFVPFAYLREVLMLAIAALSYRITDPAIRRENGFNFGAIVEVAALFFGIFVTMSVPMELLNTYGERVSLTHPASYFWCSGVLSSFLDNAPTYLIFFSLAHGSSEGATGHVLHLLGGGQILIPLLTAVSIGSVFMGANSYIGNGPNFMVKKIADEAGVKMPSFFAYMAYSGMVLIPLFALITVIFFRRG